MVGLRSLKYFKRIKNRETQNQSAENKLRTSFNYTRLKLKQPDYKIKFKEKGVGEEYYNYQNDIL